MEMHEKKVTVVVPIYNVEKYLDRCIESVVNQTYKNLEIILVDDGSPDACPQMCDAWEKKDKRIKVVHKKNAGLGMARNTGIDNASGDYICFFDSDDYVANNTIEKLILSVEKNNADVAIFGFHDVDKDGNIVQSFVPNTPKTVYVDKEIQKDLLPNMISLNKMNLMCSACMMMFSMQLIRNSKWHFVSEREIISEDVYSLIDLYASVKVANVIPEAFYNYCRNEGSLTRKYRDDRFDKIKVYYDKCIDMCKMHGYENAVLQQVGDTYFSYTIGALKQIVMSSMPITQKYKKISEIVMDSHLQKTINEVDINKGSKFRRLLMNKLQQKSCKTVFLLVVLGCIRNGR